MLEIFKALRISTSYGEKLDLLEARERERKGGEREKEREKRDDRERDLLELYHR